MRAGKGEHTWCEPLGRKRRPGRHDDCAGVAHAPRGAPSRGEPGKALFGARSQRPSYLGQVHRAIEPAEADIAQVTEGQRADVYPAAHPDTPLAGTVQSIASVARQAMGQQSLTFLVKILLDNQDEIRIRPGMSVRADIYTETSDETISVPVQAVQYEDEIGLDEEDADESEAGEEKTYVFVFEDGKAVRRDVKTGISSDSDQQIVEGLEEGERVIVGPYRVLRNLADGDEVKEADPSDEDDEDDED